MYQNCQNIYTKFKLCLIYHLIPTVAVIFIYLFLSLPFLLLIMLILLFLLLLLLFSLLLLLSTPISFVSSVHQSHTSHCFNNHLKVNRLDFCACCYPSKWWSKLRLTSYTWRQSVVHGDTWVVKLVNANEVELHPLNASLIC